MQHALIWACVAAVNSASATTHRLARVSRGAHILSSADAPRGDFQLADLSAHSTPPDDALADKVDADAVSLAPRGDFQLADLSAHSTPPDAALADNVDADAVSLRRRLRIECGRAWLWEPISQADPGISWELIGIVQECRLWPRGEAGAESIGCEEVDRTRAGYGSATRTSAYATTDELRARKRTSAVLRLK